MLQYTYRTLSKTRLLDIVLQFKPDFKPLYSTVIVVENKTRHTLVRKFRMNFHWFIIHEIQEFKDLEFNRLYLFRK
jgi:hypothetical protein